MAGTTTVETLPLAGGLLTVEVPARTEVEERAPGYDVLLLPDDREVHVVADVIRGPDEMFAPDVAAEHTVAKHGAIARPEGNFYRDVQPAGTLPGPDGRPGKVFLRFDRYREHTLRAVVFSPGRFDGESDASRAETDAVARRLAESARFADKATPLDHVAPDPGEALVNLHDVLLFTLPPGWTCKDVYKGAAEDQDDGSPVFLRAEMRCRSADKRFRVDAHVAVAETEPLAAEEPGSAAMNYAHAACENLYERDKTFDPNIEVSFDGTPHSTGVVRTDPYDARRQRLVRVHALVGPERVIYAEFTVTGPRRGRPEDLATMKEIDTLLGFAQPWHPRHADVLAATPRLFVQREPEPGAGDEEGDSDGAGGPPNAGRDGGWSSADTASDAEEGRVGLALDMVRLPIPAGWTWEAGPPFGGSFVSADGWRLGASVQSVFDPGALSDPARLADLAAEEGFSSNLPAGTDVFANIMVLSGEYAADGTPPDRPIVLKSLERCGETNIRILRIEVPLGTDADPAHAVTAAMEILLRADWAPATTPFDSLAPSAEAKLADVGGWCWFRIPAGWTMIPKDDENASADDPDKLETVWVSARLYTVPTETVDRAKLETIMRETLRKLTIEGAGDAQLEWLSERDLMTSLDGHDKDDLGPLRRHHRIRLVAFDGHFAILQFNHVVDRDTDDARRAWTRQFVRDALAAAVVMPGLR